MDDIVFELIGRISVGIAVIAIVFYPLCAIRKYFKKPRCPWCGSRKLETFFGTLEKDKYTCANCGHFYWHKGMRNYKKKPPEVGRIQIFFGRIWGFCLRLIFWPWALFAGDLKTIVVGWIFVLFMFILGSIIFAAILVVAFFGSTVGAGILFASYLIVGIITNATIRRVWGDYVCFL